MALYSVAFLITILPNVLMYPNGVPEKSCGAMYPVGHMVDAQTSTPPYEIAVKPSTYTPGSRITVMLTVKPNLGVEFFRGVFVQARVASCDEANELYGKAVGTFTLSIPATDHIATIKCGHDNAAICHKNSSNKSALALTWNAPDDYVGDIYFRATVVKQKVEFWMDIFSDFVTQAAVNVNETSERPERCPVFTKISQFDLKPSSAVVFWQSIIIMAVPLINAVYRAF